MSMPHEIDPLKVHVASVEAGISLTPAPRKGRNIRTVLRTFIIAVGDPDVYEFLPASPKRRRAVVLINTGIAGGTNSTSYGWLSPTKADAQHQQGAYITAGSVFRTFELHGTGSMYLAIDPAATTQLSLTLIAEYDDD
jgi:hypothetical protein